MGQVFAAIGQFFTDLLAKIAAVVQWVADAVGQVFSDLWEMMTDVFVWLIDEALGLVVAAVSALDVEIPSVSEGFGALPAEMINILGLLGLGPALAVIGVAILIRLGLQLIPFVRLGS